MSLGNENIHQKGEIPEIVKLPNNRIRVIRRFQKFTREDVDNVNLGSLMGDFGATDTTDEQILNQGYTDCRLIEVEVDNRFNALSNAENPILVKTYETLTNDFVETTDPTVTFSENGLKEITKIYRAVSGTPSSNVIGEATLASGEILATSSIKDNTAFAELTEVYRQSGVINVTVGRDDNQQTVSVECVGLSEIEVRGELMSLIGTFPDKDQSDFATATISTKNVEGLEVQVYTFKINELTTLETTSDDLSFVRKIDLSGGNFSSGVINSTSLTFDGDTYTLRKEEINNTGLIKKRTRIFALYDSDSFPANTLFEIDKTYGIAIPVARQIIPSATASGTISSTEAIQIEPVDSFRSLSYKILASDVNSTNLPEQVWYEKRNVSIFPDELISAEIVGTESPVFVANYKEAPKVGLKAKITRKFSWGAPSNASTVVGNNYQPQPFSKAIEVEVTRNSTSVTGSSSTNNSNGSSTSNSISNNNTQSDSDGNSTSNSNSSGTVTTDGTSQSSTNTSGTNSSNSSTNSTTAGTNATTSAGSSSGSSSVNSSSSSSNSSSVGSSSNSSVNSSSSSSGSSSNSSSVNSSISSSGQASSARSISSDMVQDIAMSGTDRVDDGTSSRTTRSKMDAVPNPSDPARNVDVEAITSVTSFTKTNQGNNRTSGSSDTSNNTNSSSQSNTNSNSNSNVNSSNNSNVNSNTNSNSNSNSSNSGSSNVTSNSSGTNNSNNNSTSNSTNNSTVASSSNSSGTNNSNSTSSGTTNSSSVNTSTGTSTSRTNTISKTISDSSSNSQSQSTNNSNSNSTSRSTSKSIIAINVKPSLREEKTVQFGTTIVTIPATTPTNIARGSYIEIERSSSHWKYNIWVEQIVEVLLPS